MVRRVAVLALVAVAAAGCGHTQRRGTVKLDRTPPPVYPSAPGRNIGDVEFLTQHIGFLVASKGQFDREPARIQRTTDGGRTWRDVWRAPRGGLDWITFADRRHGFAGGNGFVLRTSDGGSTWRRSAMSVPKRVQRWWLIEPHFVTPSVGFAVTNPASFAGQVFLRTVDGGLHWNPVRGLQTVSDVDFVSPRTGFALGRRLYRTDDGGASWRAIAIPRVPYSLAAVDFLDERRGFVGGGFVAMTEQGPSQVVFATEDGGRTWQRRYVNPHRGYSAHGGNPFVRLHFIDARRGWATTGLCKCCPSGPCVGVVYVTRDGGYSWRRSRPEVQLTTVGVRDAWALPGCDFECDVLWRTTDAGRTWRPIARPDRINFSSVTVRSHVMALRSYDDANFVSRDGGKTWRLGTVGPRRLRATIGKRFYADETCGSTSPFVEAGRVLRVTYDGGVTWRVVNTPIAPASVAVGADLVVVVGLQDCSAALAVSRDGGKRWSVSRLAHACEPSVAPAGGDVWLACDRLLLQSDDFGRSWLRLRVAIPIASIAPTGQGEAWIVAGNGASIDDKNRLWRATDRGKTWHQVWPALPTRG